MKPWLGLALRTSAVAAGWCAGTMTVLLLTAGLLIPVLWGADWQAARAEWERFKAAWWGPWPAIGMAAQADAATAGELTEFRSVAVGLLSGDAVVTGIRRAPGSEGKAVYQYCYFAHASGAGQRVIHLAEKKGAAPVQFHPIDDRHAAEAGLSAAELEAFRGRCRFAEEKS